jgi:hypothetical protein
MEIIMKKLKIVLMITSICFVGNSSAATEAPEGQLGRMASLRLALPDAKPASRAKRKAERSPEGERAEAVELGSLKRSSSDPIAGAKKKSRDSSKNLQEIVSQKLQGQSSEGRAEVLNRLDGLRSKNRASSQLRSLENVV